MALKRINKELTDLGRYVITLFPRPSGRMFTRMTGYDAGCKAAGAAEPCRTLRSLSFY